MSNRQFWHTFCIFAVGLWLAWCMVAPSYQVAMADLFIAVLHGVIAYLLRPGAEQP